MSTVVYQGLQSYIESQAMEATTLTLKVASPSFDDTIEIKEKLEEATTRIGDIKKGWSFFQSIFTTTSSSPKESISEKKSCQYVHPLTTTSPRLSQESLKLCTENLGSETGSDTMLTDMLYLASSSSLNRKSSAKESKSKANSRSFPPPLTIIRQLNPLQLRPHREDGRLIIKAIETSSRNTYLQAERSNGRLTICFWKETAADFDSETIRIDQENDEADIEDDKIIDEEYNESDDNDEEDSCDEEDEHEEDDGDDAYTSNDMEGNSVNDVVELGMEKFQRLSRCKEGGHGSEGLCDWRKPLWVATS